MKHLHFIGICGVAMSALAIAFKKAGYTVTGSDAGFFPPISTELEKQGIDFYPGWHPEKMALRCDSGQVSVPDLVVVGNVAGSNNPEWQYVQEHKLKYQSYPEVIASHFIKKNSIVCAGNYGKTSTTTLLSWILSQAGYNPSYMFGGLITTPPPDRGRLGGGYADATNTDFPSAALGSGDWSVVEGDEYKSARWDNRPKFAHYSPTHLLLTDAIWDHADIYPTEADYDHAFENLIQMVPNYGYIIANSDSEKVRHLISSSRSYIATYGKNPKADFVYHDIEQTRDGLCFKITHNHETHEIKCKLLGEYQAANITGVFAMSHLINIPTQKCIAAIASFPGIKRRLEKRFDEGVTIFDDIAHSPAKAAATLATLRSIYDKKIIAIFEPNTGNRQPAAIPGYDRAFRDADIVIIPKLTKIKKDPLDTDLVLESESLRDVIIKTHPNVISIEDDAELIAYLMKHTECGDVIAFLGSHGFRGMIEELCEQIHTDTSKSKQITN